MPIVRWGEGGEGGVFNVEIISCSCGARDQQCSCNLP